MAGSGNTADAEAKSVDSVAAHIDLVQTAPGGAATCVRTVVFAGIRLAEIDLGAPHIVFLSPPKDSVVFIFSFTSLPGSVWNGAAVRHDTVLMSSGSSLHLRTSAARRWGIVAIARPVLAGHARALLGTELETSEASFLRPPPVALGDIRRVLGQACRLGAAKPRLLARRGVARALEQDLVRALICGLEAATACTGLSVNRRHVGNMVRFERALAKHSRGDTSLPALCREIGVSARTLQNCCDAFLGCSPIAYASLRRLNRARTLLAMADPAEASVAAIAAHCGFKQPGRFALTYRNVFGERPSQTLSRPPATSADSA